LVTLGDLINKNILDKCTILSGANNLSRIVTSVSVLETPDYEKYIIEDTLILTTLYPVKNDLVLFEKLLAALSQKRVSGLAIKLHRYIDTVPTSILELANSLDFPLIVLNSDVNFSILFHDILSEIQFSEYKRINLDETYLRILSDIYRYPSAGELVKNFNNIDGFDILIYNPVSKKIHSSCKRIEELFNEYSKARNTLLHIGNDILFSEDIYYDNQYIYKLLLLCKKDKQYCLYNIASIYKMLVVFVYLYKQDVFAKQERFLLNFITNMTTQYNTNRDLMEAGLAFNWNIKFPISIIMLSSSLPQTMQKIFSLSLKDWVIRNFGVKDNQVCSMLIDNMTLIIVNVSQNTNMQKNINDLYSEFKEFQEKKTMIKIAYSNPIELAVNIPTVYSSLASTIRQQQEGILSLDIVCENDVQLLSLVKKLNYTDIKDFYYPLIEPIINYDIKHNSSLAVTLYTFFECQFSPKRCAEKLFIHINSLKYRLSLISELGYDISSDSRSYLSLYLALYIYLHIPAN
jgi:purine catabolism regulator